MERLTKRFDGWVMRKGCHVPCRTCHMVKCTDISPMIDRLAAYEDTGLEPETVNDLLERFQSLYEMVDDLDLIDRVHFQAFLERVRRWNQAEKDGRLVVLPCNMHDPLYIINNGEIHRNYGCQWHFTGKECQTFGTLSMYGEFVGLDDFGKTVFLTREEAEAAMRGGIA